MTSVVIQDLNNAQLILGGINRHLFDQSVTLIANLVYLITDSVNAHLFRRVGLQQLFGIKFLPCDGMLSDE